MSTQAQGPPSISTRPPVHLKSRQHEVQAVSGPGGWLAVAWTDDAGMDGLTGWTCGFAVSDDGGRSWSPTLFHKHADFPVTGNPAVAMDAVGVVFAVAMSVQDDYCRGILELARSEDAGRSWSPWTTIVSKHGGIPDRPKLAIGAEGALILVYTNIERSDRRLKVLRGAIEVARSTDQGHTWSEPTTISLGPHRSRWFLDGYQGPAILRAPDHTILVSWAAYYANRVYVSSSRDSGVSFDRPVAVKPKAMAGTGPVTWLLGVTFGVPATSLAVDATGRNIVISIHEAHAMGHILLVGSQDRGKTWSRLARLTVRGTNASLVFDPQGCLHAIWTELRGHWVDTRYAISGDNGFSFGTAISLAEDGARVALPVSTRDREECEAALGSYQSLIIDGACEAHAFWIDLREGLTMPRLFTSHWRI